MPVLRVARRRRLLGEPEALVQDLALHRAGEVEPPTHGPGRREEFVRGQLEHGRQPTRFGGCGGTIDRSTRSAGGRMATARLVTMVRPCCCGTKRSSFAPTPS